MIFSELHNINYRILNESSSNKKKLECNKDKESLLKISALFSQLASIQKDEFVLFNNNNFEKYHNNFWNRLVTYFKPRRITFEAIENLMGECAQIIESHYNTNLSKINLKLQRVLQKINTIISEQVCMGLENLKTSWNDQISIREINSLKSKINLLNDVIISLNNSITLKNKKNNSDTYEAFPIHPKSDDYLEKYVKFFFNKEIAVEPPSYFSKNLSLSYLSQLFGDELTQEIVKTYGLQKANFLSSIDLNALLIGIVANITKKDLQYIKTSGYPILFPQQKEDLSDAIVDVKILEKLRSIPLFTENDLKLKNLSYQIQLEKDQVFLQSCQWINNLNLSEVPVKTVSLQHFSYTEYLSRQIVYGIHAFDEYTFFKEGTLVPVPISKDSKKIVLMETHTLQSQKGLHAIVLIPADLEKNKDFSKIPVQIIFRGTRNYAAWNRNLNPREKTTTLMEWEGPGARSFEKSKNLMLNRLEKILSQLPKKAPLKIEIMGHSLGGTDSQRMCEAVAFRLCTSELPIKSTGEDDEYPVSKTSLKDLNIQQINFFGYNSPGIERNINNSFLKCAALLPHIKFQLRYFKVHHDMIQTFASYVLGFHSDENPLPPNIFTSVFKFTKPESAFAGWDPTLKYSRIPHSQFNLSAYQQLEEKIPNDVWIQYIITNNPKDVGILYHGSDVNNTPLKSTINSPKKVQKSLINPRWIHILYAKFIVLIRFVGEQITKRFNYIGNCLVTRFNIDSPRLPKMSNPGTLRSQNLYAARSIKATQKII